MPKRKNHVSFWLPSALVFATLNIVECRSSRREYRCRVMNSRNLKTWIEGLQPDPPTHFAHEMHRTEGFEELSYTRKLAA